MTADGQELHLLQYIFIKLRWYDVAVRAIKVQSREAHEDIRLL